MTEFFANFLSRVKAAQDAPVTPAPQAAPAAAPVTAKAGPAPGCFGDVIDATFPDPVRREKIVDEMILPVLTKLTRSVDIFNWRFADLYDRWTTLRNEETAFLNYLESQGPPVPMSDYRIEWREWNMGQDEAEVWNVEDDLPGEFQSTRSKRGNTGTCVGKTVEIGMLTQSMFQDQIGSDLMVAELDNVLVAIRRKENEILLANTEITLEMAGSVPQLGGFITRSTLNGVAVGGGDLTRALLQSAIDLIANNDDAEGLTYNLPLLAFTNARQLGVLRDIIISEYNGITPQARMGYESTLAARVAPYGVNVQMAMEFLPGPTIGFVLDPMLPAGTTILFDPRQPRLAKMKLNNKFGPYTIMIPNTKLATKNVAFDLISLIDRQREGRGALTGHL